VKIRLFCLAIFMGAGALFLMPQFSMAEGQNISISAIVLEQITYQRVNQTTTLLSNATSRVSTQRTDKFLIFSLEF
jgi:hypothetical protein